MSQSAAPLNGDFEALLEYLKRTRGFDFTAYKRPSLKRRIEKRLVSLGIERSADYIDYLEVHPEEFTLLFNTILINVTDFFRDEPAWQVLREDILPRILEAKPTDRPIRVWSAGCAAGQEAYSVAMCLAQALGEDVYRERVKIYGTDLDEESLNEARQAGYTSAQVESVPPDLRQKYFEVVNNRYLFRKDLRRSVIFGRHDLLQDSPISRVDLLLCRNALMYFNAEAQARILSRFNFALNGGGFLFLGKAEVLLSRHGAFAPVDLKHRFFSKLPQANERNLSSWTSDNNFEPNPAAPNSDGRQLPEKAIEVDPTPQILADANNRLILANAQARLLFGLSSPDLGQRLPDLQLAYRPLELRFLIEQVFAERRTMTVKEVEWTTSAGDRRYFDVVVQPLWDGNGQRLGIRINYNDLTRFKHLQDELNHSHQALETANEELQSSNEELETTNEELQSTVEELETTNEELQATNEEMEAMNEELQSTNEELEAINQELRDRSDELKLLNAFLESIMTSLNNGVVVVDPELNVVAWNHRAEDLWGLRAEEVRGKNFLNLDIGLPVEHLKRVIWECLSEKTPFSSVTLDATNRRGKPIQVTVGCTPLTTVDAGVQSVLLNMEEQKPAVEPA